MTPNEAAKQITESMDKDAAMAARTKASPWEATTLGGVPVWKNATTQEVKPVFDRDSLLRWMTDAKRAETSTSYQATPEGPQNYRPGVGDQPGTLTPIEGGRPPLTFESPGRVPVTKDATGAPVYGTPVPAPPPEPPPIPVTPQGTALQEVMGEKGYASTAQMQRADWTRVNKLTEDRDTRIAAAGSMAAATAQDIKQRAQEADKAQIAFVTARTAMDAIRPLIPLALSSRLAGLTWNQAAKFFQSDPNLNKLVSAGEGMVGAVTRAILLENGVLTQFDVTRAKTAFVPNESDGVSMAATKLQNLELFITAAETAWNKYRKGGLAQGRGLANAEERAPITEFWMNIDRQQHTTPSFKKETP
jgi:hypothetical protein